MWYLWTWHNMVNESDLTKLSKYSTHILFGCIMYWSVEHRQMVNDWHNDDENRGKVGIKDGMSTL